MDTGRIYHTVRHLRATQIAGQIAVRGRRILAPVSRFLMRRAVAPPYQGLREAGSASFPLVSVSDNTAASLLDGRMRFINVERETGWPPDWDSPDASLLWRYNLHYFDWLWALGFEEGREAARDWMAKHPCGERRVGWAPYPASLRIQNWTGFFFGRFRDETEGDSEWRDALWESLHRQCDWLCGRLETHLLGNHYLENGAALALAGSAFRGDDADRWLRIGTDIVVSELEEQVLDDGMHFERSPMYHLRVMYLTLLLSHCGEGAVARAASDCLPRMASALEHLMHPDGGIALLNDSAHGICHDPRDLLDAVESGGTGNEFKVPNSYPAPHSQGNWQLPRAGYYGYRGEGVYLVADAGPIGPDYIPGHAHADMFSFELSVGKQRVIVDAGTYGYEAGAMRAFCRSTRAHNTVEIEGEDQCEMWGAFRVARRGRPHDVAFEPQEDGGFELRGWHDGYRRLAGKPCHERTLRWTPPGSLAILDQVRSDASVRAVSRIHFDPACSVSLDSDREASVEWPGGALRVRLESSGAFAIEDSTTSPRFGQRLANQCLAVAFSSGFGESRIHIEVV